MNLQMRPELYIGLMCGTSMDAVDAVLVDFSQSPFKLIATYTEPVPRQLKQQALHFSTFPTERIPVSVLDEAYGHLFSDTVKKLLSSTPYEAKDIMAIGSHGQTIKHCPNVTNPYSLQVGSPRLIAQQTQIRTIADFRQADIHLGGQGAPLAPAFHNWLFRDDKINRWVLNIGGIANLTWLPADRDRPIIGYDTGPGNSLLDAWTLRFLHQSLDEGGQWAKSGELNEALLRLMLSDPYFRKGPPKSTGKEHFNLSWIDSSICCLGLHIPAVDVQRTLVAVTAHSIIDAMSHFPDIAECLICGGGIHNTFLMQTLENGLPSHIKLKPTASVGLDADWVEATCFAWLARERLANRPANIPSVTGASQRTLLGSVINP